MLLCVDERDAQTLDQDAQEEVHRQAIRLDKAGKKQTLRFHCGAAIEKRLRAASDRTRKHLIKSFIQLPAVQYAAMHSV